MTRVSLEKVILFIVFLLESVLVVSQESQKVDSTILAFETSKSSLEKFSAARQLAHTHPNVSVALEYSHIALNLALNLKKPFLVAQAYEEIGLNERILGNKSRSAEAILKALEIFDSLGEDAYKAASFVQLGSNLVVDNEYKKSIGYFKSAIDIYQSEEEVKNLAYTTLNLSEAFRLSGELDSAIYYLWEVLHLNDSLSIEILEGYARGNLGMALRSKGELAQAKEELTKANEILTELGDPYSVSVYTADLAQISIVEGKQALAEVQLLRAYGMAKTEGLKEQIRDFSQMLVSFYEGREDFSKALDYQKVYQVYQDSLVNKENVQEVERLKANYEINKREGEISLLEKLTESQQTFNLALGGGLLVFGVLAALLYQSNKQRREANIMLGKQQQVVTRREEEKAVLLKELNHRVKNNLQMVSSLLSLQGSQLEGHPAADAIEAGRSRVEALSLIHQKLYRDDVHTTIDIREYLDQLVSNLFYSFGDPFTPDLEINNIEMDIDTAIPVSLIVNELVTNALKYAYEGIARPEMLIALYKPNGNWLLEVSDNGIGLDHEKDQSNSFGLKLVRSLVSQLDGTLEVLDVPTGGVSWKISIPIQGG